MKINTLIWALVLTLVCGGGGCDKAAKPSADSSGQAAWQSSAESTPVVQTMLVAWQSGDNATAVSNFVKANWDAPTLFAPGSALNLSEEEFRAQIQNKRSPDAVARMGTNVMAEVQPLKALAGAVAQAGVQAAAQQDYATARKHFNALKECGEALARPNSLAILQLLGQGLQKRAEGELAKLPQ